MSRIRKIQCKLFLRQGIEERQCDHHDQNTDNNRKEGQEQGFRNELRDEFSPARSKHFSYTYFFRTFFAAGSCQVHKINTCEKKDDPGNQAEHMYILYTSLTGLFTIFKIKAKMPVFHRKKKTAYDGLRYSLLY